MKTRVLLVSSDLMLRDAIEEFLTDSDYDVAVADHAKAGLAILESSPEFDIVVSNYEMPGIDGVDFYYKTQKEGIQPRHFIMTSGNPDADRISEKAGITHFLAKPYELHELKMMIDDALQKEA